MSVPSDDRTVVVSASKTLSSDAALVLPASGNFESADDGVGSNALPIGTRLFEFEITGVIGEGGFGIVYAAEDRSLERTVAIKEFMPSALATRTRGYTVAVRAERYAETFETARNSFVNEARLLARFDQPSLVKVFRFWEANGTAYMVMPLYRGSTLKARLKEFGQPPGEDWLVGVLRQLLDALEIIHAENCFHRDIAPDNVLLVEGDRPVLLDFGAARRVIGDLTQDLTVILKPGYAPVEQYAEIPSMKQGPWTDIYALGAVAYFALTGATPEPSIGRMMKDSVQPLSERLRGRYSEGFLAAIDGALKVRPEERWQNVAAFRKALDESPAAAEKPASPGTTSRPVDSSDKTAAAPRAKAEPDKAVAQEASKPQRLLPVFGAVGAVILAVAGAGVYFLMQPGANAPAQPTSQAQPAAKVEVPAQTQAPGEPVTPPASAEHVVVPPVDQGAMAPAQPTEAVPDRADETVRPMPPISTDDTPEPLAAKPPRIGDVPSRTPAPKPAASAPKPPAAKEVHTDDVSRTSGHMPSAEATKNAKVNELLKLAQEGLSQGDFSRAGRFADRVLGLDPGNAQALDIKKRAVAAERKEKFNEIKIE